MKDESLQLPTPRKPELLAPAGSWECARAAIENGADALYFGLDQFNARIRAHNFTLQQLPEFMKYLHERGLHGYVTFNTLVFTQELAQAEEYLRQIIAAGADALIVQDVGICRLIRKISPDFPIHASTQMSITSANGIAFSEHLGASLTALGRECSIEEINRLQRDRIQLEPTRALDHFPLEVFIHGALCLSCSGQCLASQALGGRSANRGECAQPCRLPYELIKDGTPLPLGSRHFPASPRDLVGLEHIPSLIQAGVTCFKIEGRLKSPEYVASICRIYRQALDTAWDLLAQNQFNPEACRAPMHQLLREKRYELEMTFSRGLGNGWMLGCDNQAFSHAQSSGNKGLKIGQVESVQHRQTLWVRSQYEIRPGDGVAFINPATQKTEQAGRVYHVFQDQGYLGLEFSNQTFDPDRVRPGDWVYKTSDPELEHDLQRSFTTDKILYQRPIQAVAEGKIGSPLKLTFSDEEGHRVWADSSMILQEAHSQPLTPEKLRQQLGRLGETPFRLETLQFKVQGSCMIAMSELNKMRRQLSQELLQLRGKAPQWKLLSPEEPLTFNLNQSASAPSTLPLELVVLVRNLEQLEGSLEAGAQCLYCDFEDLRLYQEAVKRVHQVPGASIYVAPPRMFKPGETPYLKLTLQSQADGYLVRNYDQLSYFKDYPRRGDYTLNVVNPLSAEYYVKTEGLQSVNLSYDLGLKEIHSLLNACPASWFEFTLHQHVPLFHTSFCFFCAYLTHQPRFPQCEKACEKAHLRLRDRTAVEHPLLADATCRNTVFNGRIQSAGEYLTELNSLGIKRYRVEFVDEPKQTVKDTISLYQKLLDNKISGEDLWHALKGLGLSLTRGNLKITTPQE